MLEQRHALRPHRLDGALLYFQPSTGLSLRIDAAETRHLRRTAPRVVLFGLSNACNLSCDFCSRDTSLRDRWSACDAFELLADLARAGTLEVSFGGGEPLAFPGFDDLVARLAEETPLAVHLTTNGALLTPARARALARCLGEVRLSIYDQDRGFAALSLLTAAGGRVGANLIVRPDQLDALPDLLTELASAGCCDVALLRYIGDDPALHTSAADQARLARVVLDAPLPVRLSACFADALPEVPRLFAGVDGDCGAGRDFVVIGPDRTLRACSFHHAGHPIRDAADVLAHHRRSTELATAAARRGCARPLGQADPTTEGVRLYRSFSANNSGDSVLVGRFERVEDARALFDLLAKERAAGLEAWVEMLRREARADAAMEPPLGLALLGRALLAVGYSSVDDLAELRELVWRRGGLAVYSGVHLHEPIDILLGLRPREQDALTPMAEALAEEGSEIQQRGDTLYALLPYARPWDEDISDALAPALARATALADANRAELAGELLPRREEATLASVLSRTGPEEAEEGHLFLTFKDEDRARAFAASLGEVRLTRAQSSLLIDPPKPPALLGAEAQRAGAKAVWIPRGALRISARFYLPFRLLHMILRRTVGVHEIELAAAASRIAAPPLRLKTEHGHVHATVETTAPHEGLRLIAAIAELTELSAQVEVEPAGALERALGRIAEDLTALREGLE